MHSHIRQVPEDQMPHVHSFHVQVFKTPYGQCKPNFIYIHTHTCTDYIYHTFYSLSFKPTAISMNDNMSYHSPRLRFALTLNTELQLISDHVFFQKSAHSGPPLQQPYLESCSEPVIKVQKQVLWMVSSGLSDSTPAFQQLLSLSICDDTRQLSIKYWLYLPLAADSGLLPALSHKNQINCVSNFGLI